MSDVLGLISKLGEEESRTFVHGVIDSVCEKEGTKFEQFASTLSLSEYSQLKLAITKAVKQISRNGFDRKKLTDAAASIKGASSETANMLAECVWVRREEIRSQLIKDSNSISHTNMEDYDWQTKLAVSSDKLGSLQEPLLSLDLHLNDGGVKRTENLELSREELGLLVNSLDSANKVVLQLRT